MSKLKKAMMKAKESRLQTDGADPAEPLPDRAAEPVPDLDDPRIPRTWREIEEPPDEVQPGLLKTRVEPADRRVLRRHKVMTVCHEWKASDHLKILRTQILNKLGELDGNTVLITSAHPQEGKTFTAINLAVSFSQELQRTALLVDADLRKPSIHQRFGIDVQQGLTDYLLQRADLPSLLVNPGIPKLTLLPGGRGITNSAELLGAPRMEDLVKEMKARYPDRFVIFDTSSVLTCADPHVFSRYVDGVLIVVEAERTSKADIHRVLEMLDDRPVIGLVYNKMRE